MLCLCSLLLVSTGCAEFSGAVGHGWDGYEYENTYLSTDSPMGSKALKNWRNLDIDVRKFLKEHRDPDVIYSKLNVVTFFYLKEKVQVRFDRPTVGFKTRVEQLPIPEDLYHQLRQRF